MHWWKKIKIDEQIVFWVYYSSLKQKIYGTILKFYFSELLKDLAFSLKAWGVLEVTTFKFVKNNYTKNCSLTSPKTDKILKFYLKLKFCVLCLEEIMRTRLELAENVIFWCSDEDLSWSKKQHYNNFLIN